MSKKRIFGAEFYLSSTALNYDIWAGTSESENRFRIEGESIEEVEEKLRIYENELWYYGKGGFKVGFNWIKIDPEQELMWIKIYTLY